MPLVYADEDVAAAVMGAWHGQYARAMGVGAQEEYMPGVRRRARRGRRVRHRPPAWGGRRRSPGLAAWGYTPPSPQMGALYEAGMGDVRSDFARWSNIIDQYHNTYAVRIDRGGVRVALARTYAGLARQRDYLRAKFGPGAAPGSADIAAAGAWNKQARTYRDAVGKARDRYGLLPPGAPPTPEQAKPGGFPVWLLVPAAALLLG